MEPRRIVPSGVRERRIPTWFVGQAASLSLCLSGRLSHIAVAILIALSTYLPLAAAAQDCTYYGESLSDPFRGSIDTPGQGSFVEIRDDHFFVLGTDWPSCYLTAVDYSDPDNLAAASSINTEIGFAHDYTLWEDYALVVGDTTRFALVDVSDPTQLSFLGETRTVHDVSAVVGHQNYAYLATSNHIEVMDIADPTSPTSIAIVSTVGTGQRLAVSGQYLFVAESYAGIEAFDIDEPSSPLPIDTVTTLNPFDLAIVDQYAYVADHLGGLVVVDVSDPGDMHIVGQANVPFSARRIAVENGRAYLTGHNDGVQVFDITDPTDPIPIWNYATTGLATDVACSGDLLVIVDGIPDAQIIDLTMPIDPPEHVSSLYLNNVAWRLVVEGAFAYVVKAPASALAAVDLTDPAQPVERGSIGIPGGASDMDVQNGFVYVVGYDFGFRVYDVNDPDLPALADVVSVGGNCRSVAVAGNIALVGGVVNDTGLLSVFDIETPDSPQFLGSLSTTPDGVEDIALVDDLAYLAIDDDGLLIVDISTPESPTVRGQWLTPEAMGVVVAGAYAYIADEDWGLVVVDISEPTDLEQVGLLDVGFYEQKVVVAGGYAYVSGYPGFAVVDISDPAVPDLVTVYETSNPCEDIRTDGQFLYVAESGNGLNLYYLQCEAETNVPEHSTPNRRVVLLGNHPNPFNPLTTIEFELPGPENVDLTVYDLSGRLVRSLLNNEFMRAGRQHATWNGRDERGYRSPSGVYFYRIEVGDITQTKRMMLVK